MMEEESKEENGVRVRRKNGSGSKERRGAMRRMEGNDRKKG